MFDDLAKTKFHGEYLFKFRMIMERTAFLMNQKKQEGLEYRQPSDKIPFIAYVESVNPKASFDIQDQEASDNEPGALHPSYGMSIVDGYTRAICRFTQRAVDDHYDSYVEGLQIPKLAGKYITIHNWSVQGQPVLNDQENIKVIRSEIDNSICKTIRFNLFVVIHEFSILMDVPLDNEELKFGISNDQGEYKDLQYTPMVKRCLKEHLRNLQILKNKQYQYYDANKNTAQELMQQQYDNLEDFLDSQQIDATNLDQKPDEVKVQGDKCSDDDEGMDEIYAELAVSIEASQKSSIVDALLMSQNDIKIKKRDSKCEKKVNEEVMTQNEFEKFKKWNEDNN